MRSLIALLVCLNGEFRITSFVADTFANFEGAGFTDPVATLSERLEPWGAPSESG
ncbi:MAG: hypothetical protein WEB00_03115 [Dehalococcoidia bacterium]